MTSPLVETKLYIPRVRRGLVAVGAAALPLLQSARTPIETVLATRLRGLPDRGAG